METAGGTKRPFDQQLTCGLTAVYHRDRERSSLLAVDQCTAAYFVSVNPFHARHVR